MAPLFLNAQAFSASYSAPGAFVRSVAARPVRLALEGWQRRAPDPVRSLFGVLDPPAAAARLTQDDAGWFLLALLLFAAAAACVLAARGLYAFALKLQIVESKARLLPCTWRVSVLAQRLARRLGSALTGPSYGFCERRSVNASHRCSFRCPSTGGPHWRPQ